jgi:pterin-4a-carbinolamine dehydratase
MKIIEIITEDSQFINENLRKWFKDKWVRFGPDGKIRGACARGDDSEGKPKCLPQSKAHSLGKKGRASAARRKRREDPNPERRGPAVNVATKKESIGEGQFRARDVEERKFSNEKLNDIRAQHTPMWEMLDHRILSATYICQDHRQAEKFVNFINKQSEKLDHFAEVTQDVADVTVKTTTTDVNGLTILDFKLAKILDKYASANNIEHKRMTGNFEDR